MNLARALARDATLSVHLRPRECERRRTVRCRWRSRSVAGTHAVVDAGEVGIGHERVCPTVDDVLRATQST